MSDENSMYHPIFGDMGAKAEAPEPSSASMYVGREAIKKEQQARPAQATLYAMPAQAMSSAGAVSVTNLSQLAASTGALELGGKLGSTAASVEIKGAMDFCMFLNGIYLKLRDTLFNDKPVYRTKLPATSNTPSFCNGNHLYLFYHERNAAWVIGMKVNAGSGACAYFVEANAQSPDLITPTPSNNWHVSMENGGFSECHTMTCTVTDDGEIDPPADFKLPSDRLIPGRNEAEALLRGHAARLPQSAGYFVVRESTSVPNAHVMSILLMRSEVEHLIVTRNVESQLLQLDPQYSDPTRPPPPFTTLLSVQEFGASSGFIIRGTKIKLKNCIHGMELLRV